MLVSADILQAVAEATTVRVRDGEAQLKEGPFVVTEEKLNGTFVLRVAELDAAVVSAGLVHSGRTADGPHRSPCSRMNAWP